jgi:hypothetical protein
LAAAELLDLLLFIKDLGVERDADTDTRVVLHASGLLLIRVELTILTTVGFALNDKAAVTGRDQLLEDGGELLGDLLERALNGLILGLIEMIDELLDRTLRGVELLTPLKELVALRREACVLVEGLLVDVLVLLQGLVDLSEPRLDLKMSVLVTCTTAEFWLW